MNPSPTPPFETGRLFDDEASWTAEPIVAFAGLIASVNFVQLGRQDPLGREGRRRDSGRRLATTSVRVYHTMFAKFVRHLDDAGIDVPNATSDALRGFLAANHHTRGVRLRYLRLLERVYEHLVQRGIVATNPVHRIVEADVIESDGAAPELPTAYVGPGAGAARVEAVIRDVRARGDWRSVRDAAMAAVLLGGGLKVYELGAMRCSWLSMNASSAPWIEVPRVGVSRVHRVPLQPLAADCLSAWMAKRQELGIDSELVFVRAVPQGQGKRTAPPLDKSTLYRRVKSILTEAGVEVPHLGGRTLRNTYAVSALATGVDPSLVEERLGLRRSESLDRYRAAQRRGPPKRSGAPSACGRKKGQP